MKRNWMTILALVAGMNARDAACAELREDQLMPPKSDLQDAIRVVPIDCRIIHPASTAEDDPQLKGIAYSAVGWDLEAPEDSARTVTIIAKSGWLSRSGVFMPDGSEGIVVMEERSGRGDYDWRQADVPSGVYQLTHIVKERGVVDETEVLHAYFDFTLPEDDLIVKTDTADAVCADVRTDLQAGEVRTPKQLSHVLPFVYSPTNFTGTVDGTSSRVSVVRLAGDDPDVTKWTEVPKTARVLKTSTDEGEVIWNAKKGVWRASFEILDGETPKDTQIKVFDLREAVGNGTVLVVF